MKKVIFTFSFMMLLILGYSTSASALKGKDYVPSSKNSYYMQEKGYAPNAYKFKTKVSYKKGYWYTYDYEIDGSKNNNQYQTKLKYVMKKNGLYVIGNEMIFENKEKVEEMLLPTNFKKGTKFKTSYKATGYTTSKFNNVIVSTNSKIKIAGKTYKNVVKVKRTFAKGDKSVMTLYYVKKLGVVKWTSSYPKKGAMKVRSSSTLVKIKKM